jgi:hypothetical protein
MAGLTESIFEEAVLDYLASSPWQIACSLEITPDKTGAIAVANAVEC